MTRQDQIHKCRESKPEIGAVYCFTCFRYRLPKDFCEYAKPRGKKIVGRERKSKRSTKKKWITVGDVNDEWSGS